MRKRQTQQLPSEIIIQLQEKYKKHMDETDRLFRTKLPLFLKYRNWNQTDFAFICGGKTQNIISKYVTFTESQKARPNFIEVAAMCHVLQCSISFFLNSSMTCEEADLLNTTQNNYIKGTLQIPKSLTELQFIETSIAKKLFQILDTITHNRIVLVDTTPENGQSFALQQYAQKHKEIIILQNKNLDAFKNSSEPFNNHEKINIKKIVVENVEKLNKEILERIIEYSVLNSYALVFIGKGLEVYFNKIDLIHRTDKIEYLGSLTINDRNLFISTYLNFLNDHKILKKIRTQVMHLGIYNIITIIKQYAA